MIKRCKNIRIMLNKGYIPKVGDIIDAYNYKPLRGGQMGTVKCNIDSSNLWFVVVKE